MRDLTDKERVFIGGVGAMAPVVLNLLLVDIATTLSTLTLFIVIGYLVRVVVLFCLGGFVAYLHAGENSRIKLFEFGIAAPAMVVATLNGSAVQPNHTSNPTKETGAMEYLWKGFIGTARAAESSPSSASVSGEKVEASSLPACHLEIKDGTELYGNMAQEFFQGFLGKAGPRKVFMVIVGGYSSPVRAQEVVCNLRSSKSVTEISNLSIYLVADGKGSEYIVSSGKLTSEESAYALRKAISVVDPKLNPVVTDSLR